ncbi:DUF1517 domain-containing protein [Tychonema sp. BBK16]|uniref:DUF1517 domain-containing protein n=1 Tax=Tychonema sp. BBK16 TaxID=2699888 RepID=UPI001F209504|nr:DUF1517 domain-containing protein [Tychonema sp. BBK16]MCF6373602.1 DUF1517 domain-containing protein [Tychonema sp. BBK16]
MYKQLISRIKPLLKSLFAIGLVLTLAFSNADGAMAARSGGRMGGGSFRAPARSFSSPSRTYAPSGGGYYPGGGFGGGFGFPFLLPFFGFGGGFGGLFSILIFISIANFLVQSFRKAGDGSEIGNNAPTTVSVARLQVGLLAEGRGLQSELDGLAKTVNTDTATGRAQVLQESTLALLRHPEYWVYAGAESQQTRLEAAESKFNQFSLAERSKFSEETLSNFNNQIRQSGSNQTLSSAPVNGALVADDLTQAPGEYIVVTVIVGTQGKLQLPTVKNSEDLRVALRQIGGVSSEQLLAIEVLWTPQANGDTLTADDMLAGYPDLRSI